MKRFTYLLLLILLNSCFLYSSAQNSSGGCQGTITTCSSGYYGGFEAGSSNISATTGGSDLYNGLPKNGSYQIVNNVNQLGGGGYLNIQPHSGGSFLAAHTSNNVSDRVWYTNISVVPGATYNFCAYATLLKNLGSGANFVLGLYANGVSIGTGSVDFGWSQICGSYTVPAGVTTLELSIRDPKKGLFFVALDDICITSTPPPPPPPTTTPPPTNNGCPGNLVTNTSGYYGGFEAGSSNISGTTGGSDLYNGLPKNGSYQIVNSISQLGGGGYLNIQPHSGSYFLAAHTSNNVSDRVWYTNIKVVPGATYNFCTYVTLLKNLGSGANYVLGLYANGVSIGTGSVDFNWSQICGTYTVPAGVTTLELSIRDPKKGLFFVAIDDICITGPPVGNLRLGNQVWNDRDGDGKRDANEPAIGGAPISLYTDNNGDNLPDGPAIKTTMSDAQGHYLFTGLPDGRYIASMPILPGYQQSPNKTTGGIVGALQPGCCSLTPDANLDNDNNLVRLVGPNGPGGVVYTNAITLTTGQEPTDDGDDANGNLTFDLAECGNSGIGDFVWNDLNGNGIQDAGEPGINGVLVTITFEDGTTASVLTHTYNATNNANAPQYDGYYDFINLGPGTYKITFATPAGLHPSPANQGSDDAKDSDPVNGAPVTVTLAPNQSDFTIDAGFTNFTPPPPPPPSTCPNLSIGNMVFIDANGNGVKDASEQGVGGLTVKLYEDNDGNNVPDGAAIATIMTAADGTYYFGNLAAGKYIVGVTTGSAYTQDAIGDLTPDDDKDNDNNGIRTVNGEVFSNAITLAAGSEPVNDGSDNNSNLTLDFGLATCGSANLKQDDQTVVSVFPNPASSYCQVKVDAIVSGQAQIRITDAAGNIVASKTVTISTGSNAITFSNLSTLKSGTYNVQLIFNYHVYNSQLILIN